MSYTDSESIRYNPDGSKTVTTILTELPDSKGKALWGTIKLVAFLGAIVGPFLVTYYQDVQDKKRNRKALEEIANEKGVKIEIN